MRQRQRREHREEMYNAILLKWTLRMGFGNVTSIQSLVPLAMNLKKNKGSWAMFPGTFQRTFMNK